MNAKSSTRLRVECLETRSLLSAIGLPWVPLVAPPSPPAVLGEFHQVGGHPFAQPIMQDAAPNGVAMLRTNPMLPPDQLFPSAGDSSFAQATAGGRFGDHPNPVRTEVSGFSGENGSFLAVQNMTPAHDFHPTGDPTNRSSFLPDLTPDVAGGLADSDSALPIQNLPDVSRVVNLDSTEILADEATTTVTIDVSLVLPSPGMPQNSLPSSHGMADEQSASTALTVHESPPLGLLGDIAPDASPAVDPPAVDPAELPHYNYIIEFQPVLEIISVDRGPAGFRSPPSRAADEVVQSVVENDVLPSVEPSALPASPASSASPAKGSIPDMLAASDVSRVGDQALAAAETSLPASSGVANPPATNAAFSDAAASNSLAAGYIALDASAATPQLGNAPSYNTGFNGMEGPGLERGIWLTDVLPSTHRPADLAGRNDKAAPAGDRVAAEVAGPAVVISQPVVGAEEGGSIELAMAAPSPGAAGDDSLPAESTAGNAAQQMSEIRPESGVGLFCDIEVATAPLLPLGDSPSVAAAYQDVGPFVAVTAIHSWKANAATESVSPLAKAAQPTLAGLAENLPLLLGATILVSRGGLRLEEKVSQRERRLRSIEDLWRSRW